MIKGPWSRSYCFSHVLSFLANIKRPKMFKMKSCGASLPDLSLLYIALGSRKMLKALQLKLTAFHSTWLKALPWVALFMHGVCITGLE